MKGKRVEIGDVFGGLTVLRRNASSSKNRTVRWDCLCMCGRETTTSSVNLKNGSSSCGCRGRRQALLYKVFGKLTVQAFSHKGTNGKLHWRCQCDCGNTCTASTGELTSGDTNSCGCLRSKLTSIRLRKHELLGKTFGKLVVTERLSDKNGCNVTWRCQCACGTNLVLSTKDLVEQRYKSCGCGAGAPRLTCAERRVRAMYRAYKNNAKRKGREFLLTEEAFRELTARPCYYCGAVTARKPRVSNQKSLSGKFKDRYHEVQMSGIDRVDNSRGYTPDNCVPCCKLCNRMKMDTNKAVLVSHILQIVKTLTENRDLDITKLLQKLED